MSARREALRTSGLIMAIVLGLSGIIVGFVFGCLALFGQVAGGIISIGLVLLAMAYGLYRLELWSVRR